MKTTRHYKGHRWTTDELKQLMALWQAGEVMETLMDRLNSTQSAILKMIQALRKQGIPLIRRDHGRVKGEKAGSPLRAVSPGKYWGRPWTQSDMEYVIRRRRENATAEDLAIELGRSVGGINGVIQKLRKDHVPVPMRGQGVRRLWDANQLRAKFIEDEDIGNCVN